MGIEALIAGHEMQVVLQEMWPIGFFFQHNFLRIFLNTTVKLELGNDNYKTISTGLIRKST